MALASLNLGLLRSSKRVRSLFSSREMERHKLSGRGMSFMTPVSLKIPSSLVMLVIVVFVAVAVRPRMVFIPNFSLRTYKKNIYK